MKNSRKWGNDSGEVIYVSPATTDLLREPKLTVESIDNHVYFYSEVDSDRCLALMRAIKDKESFLTSEHIGRGLPADFPMTPVWLHVNSGGGSIFDALAVADQLKVIGIPVYSIVEGFCASAATIISMSCAKRYIMPSAYFMVHQFSSFVWGKYEEFKDEMKLQDMLMVDMVEFYSKNSKMPADEVREMLKRDSWFNAEEAIEKGFVDSLYVR